MGALKWRAPASLTHVRVLTLESLGQKQPQRKQAARPGGAAIPINDAFGDGLSTKRDSSVYGKGGVVAGGQPREETTL